MTTLEPGFEDKLREALLDDVDSKAQRLGENLKQIAESNFKDYASRNDYDIDHIWEDAEGPFINRSGRSVTIRIEWPGLTALFEFGVSPHTIGGNPILHFFWEEIDQWIQTDEVDWGSETGGIPEARAIRNAQQSIQAQLQRRGPGGRFA